MKVIEFMRLKKLKSRLYKDVLTIRIFANRLFKISVGQQISKPCVGVHVEPAAKKTLRMM